MKVHLKKRERLLESHFTFPSPFYKFLRFVGRSFVPAAMILISLWSLPAQSNATYLTIKTQYIEAGSTRFAFRQFGNESDTPLVLLMHTRGNMDGWDPLLLDTLAKKRRVIAFDNIGVGLTQGNAPKNFAAMADDAAQFIKALGYKKVDLLGFSIGGAIAQELLIRHNGLIRRAILAGTSAKGGIGVNDLSEKSKVVSTKLKLTDGDLLYGFFAPSKKSQEMGRRFIERLKARNAERDEPVSMETVKAQALAREAWGRNQDKSDERMQEVKNPILIANGRDDIRMPTINSYHLFLIAPKAQLILYPDSGHGFLFQYPELCGRNFADFLDQTEIGE